MQVQPLAYCSCPLLAAGKGRAGGCKMSGPGRGRGGGGGMVGGGWLGGGSSAGIGRGRLLSVSVGWGTGCAVVSIWSLL